MDKIIKQSIVHDKGSRLRDFQYRVLSADSIADEEGSNLYPVDFLNTLNLSGLPPHCLSLRLKENTPVMLLRNLNPKQGLLNGTRLKVKKLGNKMIEAQIISGKKVEPMFSFPV